MEEHDELLRRLRQPHDLRPERRRERVVCAGAVRPGRYQRGGRRAGGRTAGLERERQLDDSLADGD